MKKVSTVAAKPSKNISQQKLTDRIWIWEIATAGTACWTKPARYNWSSACARMRKHCSEVFGAMPRSRIALEIGTHSPWISRLLSEMGHEVIVANARKVRLIGESRKKDDRLDAQTLARLARIDPQLLYPVKHRSAQAQADLMTDSGAGRPGASPDSAGEHGPWTGQELRRAIARMQRAQYESGKSGRAESGTADGTEAAAGVHRSGE